MPESKDIKMKDVQQDDVSSEIDTLVKEIEQSFILLSKVATTFDNRYVSKVFRDLGPLRRKLVKNGNSVLATVINNTYPQTHNSKKYLLKYLNESPTSVGNDAMDVDNTTLIPEIELYIHLLVQVYLLDTGKLEELNSLGEHVVQLMKSFNRRSLDFIQAKVWFYVCRAKELIGDYIRFKLLMTHDISQASDLVEKVEFPENAGNALVARYYYYLARINAIQLDYSTAMSVL
ncbi:hypothetical protein FOB64_002536 [Candida albicans]|uniref:26S proteasome non-ATPase regulatory subunit 3 N-terminal TPR repeats domain-containing protein n=1 Tax=Candida albicans TaxID=5476 RepID=A0A8H6C386_CANAX|nr:hypothetical protein FOB64_002536 [Candida albicans]